MDHQTQLETILERIREALEGSNLEHVADAQTPSSSRRNESLHSSQKSFLKTNLTPSPITSRQKPQNNNKPINSPLPPAMPQNITPKRSLPSAISTPPIFSIPRVVVPTFDDDDEDNEKTFTHRIPNANDMGNNTMATAEQFSIATYSYLKKHGLTSK